MVTKIILSNNFYFQEFLNKQGLDKDGDKKVTFEEFVECYGKADVSTLNFLWLIDCLCLPVSIALRKKESRNSSLGESFPKNGSPGEPFRKKGSNQLSFWICMESKQLHRGAILENGAALQGGYAPWNGSRGGAILAPLFSQCIQTSHQHSDSI